MSPERIARVLGVRVEEVRHHLVTALVRRARGLRAVVFEAATEADALARLCAEGVA